MDRGGLEGRRNRPAATIPFTTYMLTLVCILNNSPNITSLWFSRNVREIDPWFISAQAQAQAQRFVSVTLNARYVARYVADRGIADFAESGRLEAYLARLPDKEVDFPRRNRSEQRWKLSVTRCSPPVELMKKSRDM